jgi:hypothetical protein
MKPNKEQISYIKEKFKIIQTHDAARRHHSFPTVYGGRDSLPLTGLVSDPLLREDTRCELFFLKNFLGKSCG